MPAVQRGRSRFTGLPAACRFRAMEASRAERQGGYLDLGAADARRVHGHGRGAWCSFLSLFLPWFTTSSSNPNSSRRGSIAGGDSASAWQVFSTLDLLLVAACSAPFILAWILARGHKLTWKPGEVTMIVGMIAFVLILCNGIILGRPGDSVDIGLGIGYFVALLASAGLLRGRLPAAGALHRRAQAAGRDLDDGRRPQDRRPAPTRCARTATWRWSWCAPRSTRRWPAPAGSGAGRRSRPTARPWTRCA